MGFFEKLSKTEGGYIFISHSHNDIDKVRIIRNRLESYGFEPLCFYLKCLDDDSELEGLIEREIDAREWFLFVNSENSRKSKWVNKEREYIELTNHKKIITVSLDDDVEIEKVIDKLCSNLRVFISYSSRDYDIAKRIHNRLCAKDYLPFIAPDNIPVGKDYTSEITNAISEAAREGCVLLLISQSSTKSVWVEKEIEFALSQNGNVIPIFLGDLQDIDLPVSFQFYLSDIQWYQLNKNPSDDEVDRMIDRIGSIIVNTNNK